MNLNDNSWGVIQISLFPFSIPLNSQVLISMNEHQQNINSLNVKLGTFVFLSFVDIRLGFVAFNTTIVMEVRRLKNCTET